MTRQWVPGANVLHLDQTGQLRWKLKGPWFALRMESRGAVIAAHAIHGDFWYGKSELMNMEAMVIQLYKEHITADIPLIEEVMPIPYA